MFMLQYASILNKQQNDTTLYRGVVFVSLAHFRYHRKYCDQLCTSVHIHPDASGCTWILPRPEKHATGMFFTPATQGPASSNPTAPPKEIAAQRRHFIWRRCGDLNPSAGGTDLPDFESGPFSHLGTSPN